MDEKQLLEFAMSGDKQEQYNTGILNQYPVLGSYNKPYDPENELFNFENDGVEGEKVPDFLQEQEYKKPVFQQQDPVLILQEINVAEQLDEFRKEDNLLNSINTMFNPVSGNTPEERAKSQTINNLLAEIDNFAKQYRLSKAQVETLKTQVLGNHLGEYINVKNALAKQAKDKQRAEQIAQARGEQPDEQVITGDATVRDENNQLPKGDDSDEDEDGAGGGGGAGVLEESKEPSGGGQAFDGRDVEDLDEDGESDINPAGGQGGSLSQEEQDATAVISSQEINEKALAVYRALTTGTPTRTRTTIINTIKSYTTAKWLRALRVFDKVNSGKPLTASQKEDEDDIMDTLNFFNNILQFGTSIGANERELIPRVGARVKKLFD